MDDEVFDKLELQTALLVRNLEMFRRRNDLYVEVDRAGYLVLRRLDSDGPSDISRLAAALGLDPSTVGRQVNAVRAAGLVETSPDPNDLRRAIVRITDDGTRAMDAVRARRNQRTQEMLATWETDDLVALENMLHRYNQAIVDRYLSPAWEPSTKR